MSPASYQTAPPRVAMESGKRDSNPRPQPWQGCALPTALRPRDGHFSKAPRVAGRPSDARRSEPRGPTLGPRKLLAPHRAHVCDRNDHELGDPVAAADLHGLGPIEIHHGAGDL